MVLPSVVVGCYEGAVRGAEGEDGVEERGTLYQPINIYYQDIWSGKCLE